MRKPSNFHLVIIEELRKNFLSFFFHVIQKYKKLFFEIRNVRNFFRLKNNLLYKSYNVIQLFGYVCSFQICLHSKTKRDAN